MAGRSTRTERPTGAERSTGADPSTGPAVGGPRRSLERRRRQASRDPERALGARRHHDELALARINADGGGDVELVGDEDEFAALGGTRE
jgi:hypothetical protein